jgi:hypothetical protein
MSPRNFEKIRNNPVSYGDKIKPGMNLWYAFFSITGLDKSITKLFTFTPDFNTDNTAKHGEARVDQTTPDI